MQKRLGSSTLDTFPVRLFECLRNIQCYKFIESFLVLGLDKRPGKRYRIVVSQKTLNEAKL